MSTFVSKAINPTTGSVQAAFFIDDYYGTHRYAVAFRRDNKEIRIEDSIEIADYDVYPLDDIKQNPDTDSQKKV